MKVPTLFLLLFSASIVIAQENEKKFKVESFNLNYGKEFLSHGAQQSDEYLNAYFSGTDFSWLDSAYQPYRLYNLYPYKTFHSEMVLRKSESPWRIQLGVNYNNRYDRFYGFFKDTQTTIDTVYVPYAQYNSVGYDSLALDSLNRLEYTVESKTQNIFLYSEFLRDFNIKIITMSVGFGLAAGINIAHDVISNYSSSWGLQMVKYYTANESDAKWFGDIPAFNPANGTYNNPRSLTLTSNDYNRFSGERSFIIKPYIPITVELPLSKKGFLNHLGILAKANFGTEIQFSKNDNPRARVFWNYRFGIFYRI